MYQDMYNTKEKRDRIGIESVDELVGQLIFEEKCPEQAKNTVDCGYHICHIMNRICSNTKIEHSLTKEQMSRFKAHMISAFIRGFKFKK